MFGAGLLLSTMGKNIQRVTRCCQPIPEKLIASGWRGMVHVHGWTLGTTFKLVDFRDGLYYLRTPKSGHSYVTSNPLLTTRRSVKSLSRSRTNFQPVEVTKSIPSVAGNVPPANQPVSTNG